MRFLKIIRDIKFYFSSVSRIKKNVINFSILLSLIGIMFIVLVFYDSTGLTGDTYWFALRIIRLPKIPTMVIMGVGTAMAGLLLQKVTKNELADTGLIGITHSGVFLMTLVIMAFPWINNAYNNPLVFIAIIPLVVASAAFLTMMLMYIFSIKGGVSPKRIVLMGIGISMFFSAATIVVVYYFGSYEMHFINRYMMGWIEVKKTILWVISLSIIAVVMVIVFVIGKKIDILESSEDIAKSVGVRIEMLKFIIFALIAILIGATTAVVGSVSLLGLMAPAIARSMFKNNTRILMFGSSLVGILFVMIAQFININLLHVAAPVGIVIQLVIAPYFLYRIFSMKGSSNDKK